MTLVTGAAGFYWQQSGKAIQHRPQALAGTTSSNLRAIEKRLNDLRRWQSFYFSSIFGRVRTLQCQFRFYKV